MLPNDLGVMDTFAQRHGFRPVRQSVQRDGMDEALRNGLWNVIWSSQFDIPNTHYQRDTETPMNLIRMIWRYHFRLPVDKIPWKLSDAIGDLRKRFFECEWFDAYSLLEFIARVLDAGPKQSMFVHTAQAVLKREMSAFRFVDIALVEITSEEEIREIETVVAKAPTPVATHISTALRHLSDRVKPDYRNSIKESISAVEAAIQDLTGDTKATLGDGLKRLQPPLPQPFEVLSTSCTVILAMQTVSGMHSPMNHMSTEQKHGLC